MIIEQGFAVQFQNAVQGVAGTEVRFDSLNGALLWIYQHQSVAGVCLLSRYTETRDSIGHYGPGFSAVSPVPQGTIGALETVTHSKGRYQQK